MHFAAPGIVPGADPPDVLEEITREVGAGPSLPFYKRHWASEEYKRDQLWSIKGLPALGAFDAAERKEALDLMGIRKQLLFPNTGGLEGRVHSDAARIVCSRYNEYALDFTKKTGGRAVAAAQMSMEDPAWAIREIERCRSALRHVSAQGARTAVPVHHAFGDRQRAAQGRCGG